MGIILFFFCLFHIRLLVTNYTTREYFEKKKKNESTWQISPFDRGSMWRNAQTKLGDDPLWIVVGNDSHIYCIEISYCLSYL
jgi:hypothetical protein